MKLLADIIKIQSLSGAEQILADLLAKYLVNLGYQPQRVRGNVVVHIPGRMAHRAIIFNGHMDTVTPGNLSQWDNPPYGKGSGKIIDGKMYGLGASDEKAGITSLLLLAKAYKSKQPPLDIWMTFVANEEVDGSGSQEVLQWFKTHQKISKYTKISAIFPEPTDLSKIYVGHRGTQFFSLTVQGESGHGSRPGGTENQAIFRMIHIVSDLQRLIKEWKITYADPVLGAPGLTVTAITAGKENSPNKIADSCTVILDIRTTPSLHPRVSTLLADHLNDVSVVVSPVAPPAPPGITHPSASIVTIAEHITGAFVTVSPGASDLCFFTQAGIPAIVFGPGDPGMSHKQNEYCKLENIQKAVVVYTEIVAAYAAEKEAL